MFRSPSVGFYVDQGKVIAVNNPDYNVERTEIISSGKQSDLGLNLSKHGARPGPGSTSLARPDIDLTEWVGHRVLGRVPKTEVYCSGVIRHVSRDTCDVTVALDGDRDATLYRDVVSAATLATLPPILSDVTPASGAVSVGSKFCVQLEAASRDTGRSMFVEALVYEVGHKMTSIQCYGKGFPHTEDKRIQKNTRSDIKIQNICSIGSIKSIGSYYRYWYNVKARDPFGSKNSIT